MSVEKIKWQLERNKGICELVLDVQLELIIVEVSICDYYWRSILANFATCN